MAAPGRKHGANWPDYIALVGVLTAAVITAWIFLKEAARILTDWQTLRW
jgi:hypothetical protein